MDFDRLTIRALVPLAACCLIMIATSCGGGAPAGAGAKPVVGEESARAPDFALESVDGDEVRLSDSNGTVRLIDFWATWCAPCREEIPMLNELQAIYGEQGFRVMGISEEEGPVVREFIEDNDVQYLNLLGTEAVSEEYGVLGLPAAYLLDRDGRVVESFLGPKPRKVLESKILALLDAVPET